MEVRALMSDLSQLEAYAETDDLVTYEAGEKRIWDAHGVREYLSDARILLFHDVITAAKAAGLNFAGKNVADVGSGTGYLLRLLVGEGPARLVGYDVYNALNVVASVVCPSAEIRASNLYAIPGEAHDIVFCMETLEHQVDPAGALKHLMNYRNRDGTLVLTVPDGRVDSLESVGKYPEGTGYYGHINFWSIESLTYLLNATFGSDFTVRTMAIGNQKSNLMAIVDVRHGE